MAKKRKTKTLLAAAMAFAASPQGRQMLKQAKEHAAKPETKQRAQQLLSEVRARRSGQTRPSSSSATPVTRPATPTYGTPSQP